MNKIIFGSALALVAILSVWAARPLFQACPEDTVALLACHSERMGRLLIFQASTLVLVLVAALTKSAHKPKGGA